MHATPMISVAVAKELFETLAGKGDSPDPVLREIGLSHSALSNPEGYIAVAKLAQLLEQAAAATRDDFFGLHFGEGFNPKNIGPVIYVALNSPTIGAAIEKIERYLKIHNEAARWFIRNDGERAYVEPSAAGAGTKAEQDISRRDTEFAEFRAYLYQTTLYSASPRWAFRKITQAAQNITASNTN